jgi:acetyl-CoA carboxylase beta subunit
MLAETIKFETILVFYFLYLNIRMERSITKKIFEKQEKDTKTEQKGVLLRCQRCEHNWEYRGINPYICSCPFCHTTVRIRKAHQIEV